MRKRLTYRQRQKRTQDRQGYAVVVSSLIGYFGYLMTEVGL